MIAPNSLLKLIIHDLFYKKASLQGVGPKCLFSGPVFEEVQGHWKEDIERHPLLVGTMLIDRKEFFSRCLWS